MIDANQKILRTVDDNEAFYFCKGSGNFTGMKANSLKDFMKKIQHVDSESLEFHLNRGDFEKWITSTIGYAQLAADLQLVKGKELSGAALRIRLLSLVSLRLMELTSASKAPKFKEKQEKRGAKKV